MRVLKPLVLTPPQYYDRTRSVWFRTISHPELSELYEIFYREGKRIVPETIATYILNPLTIAVWFMDDGNLARKHSEVYGYHLNTQSFSLEENELLLEAMSAVHGIRCTIERNHEYYRLAIYQKTARDMFVNLIREHILPSMAYKIG